MISAKYSSIQYVTTTSDRIYIGQSYNDMNATTRRLVLYWFPSVLLLAATITDYDCSRGLFSGNLTVSINLEISSKDS